MRDVADRLANRAQLTTDGSKAYLEAFDGAFKSSVDYTMLVKLCGYTPGPAGRYRAAECTGAKKTPINGRPDKVHISTSLWSARTLPC